MDKSPQNQIQAYWAARMKDPKYLTLGINVLFFCYEVQMVTQDKFSEKQRILGGLQAVQSILSTLLFFMTLANPRYNRFTRFSFMITSLKQICFLLDVCDLKKQFSDEGWQRASSTSLCIAVVFLVFHFYCFNHGERGHTLFGITYINLVYLSTKAQTTDLWEYFAQGDVFMWVRFSLLQAGVYGMVRSWNVHTVYIDQTFKSLQNQHFLKLIVDSMKDSIVLLDEQRELQYSNPIFQEMFSAPIGFSNQISDNLALENAMTSANDSSSRKPLLGRVWSKVKRIAACFRRLSFRPQPASEGLTISVASTRHTCEFVDCSVFRTLKMFRRVKVSSDRQKYDIEEGYLCMKDILMAYEDFQGAVVFFDPVSSGHAVNVPSVRRNASHAASETAERYLQFTFLNLEFEGTQRLFIKIADITDTILLTQSKGEKELLSLVNATISHELRNPLNSIVAQNVAKESHYGDLEALAKRISKQPGEAKSASDQILKIMNTLNQGLQIQDSSAKLMSFLVQDFLDYAQLKQDKFRVNIKPFCIRATVEKVMAIQRQKAVEMKLGFVADFENISKGKDPEPGMESPLIRTDEQRLMQVLLNLQSNALKFTQSGKVAIIVRIDKAGVSDMQNASPQPSERILRVKVSDTGVGIPKEDQDKLFKLFGFVQSTQSLNKNGIGLGLMISQRILTKFGGAITFSSIPYPEENHGTTFEFTMPLASEEEYEKIEEQERQGPTQYGINQSCLVYEWKPSPDDLKLEGESDPECSIDLDLSDPNPSISLSSSVSLKIGSAPLAKRKAPWQRRRFSVQMANTLEVRRSYFSSSTLPTYFAAESKQGPSILIVDDQVFNISALRTILKHKFGISEDSSEAAFNGQEAVDKVAQAIEEDKPPYKLILMDCNMPFKDGFQATAEIRSLYYQRLGLVIEEQPIITAVTGHAEPKYIEKCFRFGMNQVISKPMDHEALRFTCLKTGLLGEDSCRVGKKESK